MSKWIEEKWLNKRIKDSYRERIGLDSAPSIDIVRCKECRHHFYDELNNCKMCHIHEYGEIWKDDDYCCYGEREGE